jgi:hypothetical protein
MRRATRPSTSKALNSTRWRSAARSRWAAVLSSAIMRAGRSSSIARKVIIVMPSTSTSSTAVAVVERGSPSIAERSPISVPGPMKPSITSWPSGAETLTLIRPARITITAPGSSPWWNSTSPPG